ncbi:VOC family protein [Pseudoxanthobacter sp.]|uniref:VOC family protein n=1 Tax=Pseudoxanthobacter sp. TaxID=1925742 RepID=UPI002FE266D0
MTDAIAPARPRGIDHIVQVVNDLDAAAAHYQALGFTTTPPARHPFGTGNVLVQFSNNTFLELLSVLEPARIRPAAPGLYSFAAFNRDLLDAHGEGGSMIVLRSAGAVEDRAAFAAAGLPLYAPFGFERTATGPDGVPRPVAFSLTFTADACAPDVGLFTCQSHFPQNFWKPPFQTHANGATGIAGVVVVTPDPAAHAAVFAGFTGAVPQPVAGGLHFAAPHGDVSLLTPDALAALGIAAGDPARPHIAALRIVVPAQRLPEFDHRAASISADKKDVRQTGVIRVLPPRLTHGLSLLVEPADSGFLLP